MSVSAIYVRSDDIDEALLKSICASIATSLIDTISTVKPDTTTVVDVFLHGEPSYQLSVDSKFQGSLEDVTKKLSE